MKTLSIKTRLALVLFVLVAFLMDVSALRLVGDLRSNATLKETFPNSLPSTRALELAKSKLAQTHTALDRAIFEPGPSKSANALGRTAAQIENSERTWKDYLALPFSTPEEERITGEAGRQHSLITRDGIGGAINALHHGDRDATRVLALEGIPTQFHVYAEQFDHLDAIREEISSTAYTASQSFFNGLLWTFGLVIAIELTLAIGCYVVLSRTISRPLAEMLVHFHEIPGGNLTTGVRTHSRDEMDLLMEGLQQMQAKLEEAVVTVRCDNESIAPIMQQIAAGNTSLSQRTEEQASSPKETASGMEELTSIVKQNTDNARQANTSVVNASEITMQGGAMVQDVVTTMGEVSESSRKITDIIAMIGGIAFQTSILAPSATVKAARAGEQDRDFAVVAGEIRTLTQRSIGVAKEIKSLIEDSTTRVESGSTLVARAGKMMEEIVVAVKRVTDIMGEISVSSTEQSTGIEQIDEAVTQMNGMTQQDAALMGEATAAAQALEEQANELRHAVAVLRMAM